MQSGTRRASGSTGCLNGLIGVRYFLSPRLSLFAETGSDAIAKFRAGAFFVLRQPG